METKYGSVDNKAFILYLNRMKDRVFKILPMHEENCETIDSYIYSLNRELMSHENISCCDKYSENVIELVNTIEGLKEGEDIANVKSDVFKSISIIKRMIKSIERGGC